MIEEAKVENTLELEVCLRGPERPTKYGSNRDMLAQLKVPIPGERAWMIYQYATRLAVTGEGRTTFAFTGAEAEELRVQ